MHRTLHLLSWSAAIAAAVISVLIISIRTQQYALRLRAEQLQSDVAGLEYGKTDLAQVQGLFRRWNATYQSNSAGRRLAPSVQISVADFAYSHGGFFANHPRFFRLYGILGGRPAMVAAHLTFENGVLRYKSYAAFIEVFPHESVEVGLTEYGYSLIGETAMMEKLPQRYGKYADSSTHPTYEIGWPSGCEICVKIYVHFTGSATSTDVTHLGGLDLSCLTRWLWPCRFKGDIMPAAWQNAYSEYPLSSPY